MKSKRSQALNTGIRSVHREQPLLGESENKSGYRRFARCRNERNPGGAAASISRYLGESLFSESDKSFLIFTILSTHWCDPCNRQFRVDAEDVVHVVLHACRNVGICSLLHPLMRGIDLKVLRILGNPVKDL